MTQPRIGRLLIVILGLIAVITPISAATVAISPGTIQENTPITISVKDLPDNSTFMIRIEASIPLDDSGRFSLSTNDLQMPFALNSGMIDIRAENVKTANFSAKMSNKFVTVFGEGQDGVVTIKQPGNIPQGLISYTTLEGSGTDGAASIDTSMDLSGKKIGATDADVTFTVNGFNGGSVNVKIYVDGSLLATIPATTTTTIPSSGGDGDTTTTVAAGEPVTVSSLDGTAVLTFESDALSGASADDITIMVSNRAVPEEWTAVSGPFAILPSDTTFDPSADLSIGMTEDEINSTATYTILGYTGGSWKALQSRIDDGTISTTIAAAGEYALVMSRAETTVATTTTTTTARVETTAPAVMETTTGAPATTPTESPLPLWCVLGGIAAAGLLYRKRP
ncbi:MAG: hypothetical protein PWP08_403 [Methanofollis sp.]|nr:hypothetical protein [Methanofollis sp.]